MHQTQSFSLNEISSQLHAQPYLTLVAVAGLLLSVLFGILRPGTQKRKFVNEKGEKIKELPLPDLRLKLLTSARVSSQGLELAGDEPYLIRSGKFEELVISQPDQIRDFYKNDYKAHGKPPGFNFGDLFQRFMGTAVGLRSGDEWRLIREHFDPPFKFHEASQRIGRFQREIKAWNNELVRNPSADIHARTSFKFLVFRLVCIHLYRDAFDDRLYWQLLELSRLHDHVIHDILTCKGHDAKWRMWVPNGVRRRLDRFLSEWRSFNRNVVENARGGKWDCPIEVIARGADLAHDMTEEDFLSTLGEVLFANVDVSASVLSTLFTNLAADSSVQNALRAEIKCWKADEGFDISKYLTNSSTLLHRVVMESMRLAPAFWFSMPETTAEPKTIGGYTVPANTTVIIDNRRLNEEQATWGTDGKVFRPDRFLEVAPQALRCGFMRFGAGAASGRCLGKHVADVVFKLTAISVVESFELEALKEAEGEKGSAAGGGMVADVRLVRL